MIENTPRNRELAYFIQGVIDTSEVAAQLEIARSRNLTESIIRDQLTLKGEQYNWPKLADTLGIEFSLRGKSGALVSLCLFHEEKTPSFFMYPDSNCCCYGCGVKTDVAGVIEAYILSEKADSLIEEFDICLIDHAIQIEREAIDLLEGVSEVSIAIQEILRLCYIKPTDD